MMKLKLRFPKKLFCFEFKIGAIITGWLHLILSLLGIMFNLVFIFNHVLFMHAMDFISETYNQTTFRVFEDQNEQHALELFLKLFFGIWLFVSIVNLLSACFLIYGSMKESHLHLLPWLTSEVLGMFIMLCSLFITCPYLFIVIFVRVYIWYCIWAFYREIKRIKQITGYPNEPSIAVAFGNAAPPTKPPPYGDVVAFK